MAYRKTVLTAKNDEHMTGAVDLTKETAKILNLDEAVVATSRLSSRDLQAAFQSASRTKKVLDVCTKGLLTSLAGMVLALGLMLPGEILDTPPKAITAMEKAGERISPFVVSLFFLSMIAGVIPNKREEGMKEWMQQESNKNLLADYKSAKPSLT